MRVEAFWCCRSGESDWQPSDDRPIFSLHHHSHMTGHRSYWIMSRHFSCCSIFRSLSGMRSFLLFRSRKWILLIKDRKTDAPNTTDKTESRTDVHFSHRYSITGWQTSWRFCSCWQTICFQMFSALSSVSTSNWASASSTTQGTLSRAGKFSLCQ